MGFKQGEDKIGTLTQNAGTISLAASLLTIGGQQYRTAALSRLISTDLTMTANVLYIVYAILNGSTVELRVSANMNSVGPAGFSAWCIVGAFVSGSTSAFASFIPITGLPILNANYTSNTTVTLNANVQGHMDATGIVADPFGLITQNAGAYTSATGLFATTQPKITNPIPNSKVRILAQVGWANPGLNVAGNWDVYIRRNGTVMRGIGKNGQAANSAGLNFLNHRNVWLGSGQSMGDSYDVQCDNNQGNYLVGVDFCDIEIVGGTQLKDL